MKNLIKKEITRKENFLKRNLNHFTSKGVFVYQKEINTLKSQLLTTNS